MQPYPTVDQVVQLGEQLAEQMPPEQLAVERARYFNGEVKRSVFTYRFSFVVYRSKSSCNSFS